jgi:hypothetical protein
MSSALPRHTRRNWLPGLQRLHTHGKVPSELVPVGDGLVADVVAFIRAYVVMSERQLLILALWVIHTHAFGVAEQTPYINVSSPEKRSGKTRTVEVAGLLSVIRYSRPTRPRQRCSALSLRPSRRF